MYFHAAASTSHVAAANGASTRTNATTETAVAASDVARAAQEQVPDRVQRRRAEREQERRGPTLTSSSRAVIGRSVATSRLPPDS